MGIKAAKDLLKLIARAKTMSIKDLRHLLASNGIVNGSDGEYLLPNIRCESIGSIETKQPVNPKPTIGLAALKSTSKP